MDKKVDRFFVAVVVPVGYSVVAEKPSDTVFVILVATNCGSQAVTTSSTY